MCAGARRACGRGAAHRQAVRQPRRGVRLCGGCGCNAHAAHAVHHVGRGGVPAQPGQVQQREQPVAVRVRQLRRQRVQAAVCGAQRHVPRPQGHTPVLLCAASAATSPTHTPSHTLPHTHSLTHTPSHACAQVRVGAIKNAVYEAKPQTHGALRRPAAWRCAA